MEMISLRGERHVHKCGYSAYCGGRILDQCRPPTSKESQAIKLLKELAWEFPGSVWLRFCDASPDSGRKLGRILAACDQCFD